MIEIGGESLADPSESGTILIRLEILPALDYYRVRKAAKKSSFLIGPATKERTFFAASLIYLLLEIFLYLLVIFYEVLKRICNKSSFNLPKVIH